jgi:hypothetical protein
MHCLVMVCLFDRHTSDCTTQHPNITLHISSSITSPKDSTFNDTPPCLECDYLAEVPSHPVRSYLLIPSFMTKPSSPHYLPSLSPSLVVSATPWRSEWMKHLRTAIGLTLMQEQAVRMSPGAGYAWWRLQGLFWSLLVLRSLSLFTLASQCLLLPYS